jgi:hypothetical protein
MSNSQLEYLPYFVIGLVRIGALGNPTMAGFHRKLRLKNR